MNFIEYAPLGLRTVKWLGSPSEDLTHAQVGMVTEVGELFDAWKKETIYGKSADNVNKIEEIGDCLFYINLLAKVIDLSPESLQVLWDEAVKPEAWEVVSDTEIDILTDVQISVTEILNMTLENPSTEFEYHLNPLLYNLNRLIAATGFDVSDALDKNIRKLAKRYGDKYSDQAALIRDLEVERQTLEA